MENLKLRLPVLWVETKLKDGVHPRYIFKILGYEMIGDERWDDDPDYIYFIYEKRD